MEKERKRKREAEMQENMYEGKILDFKRSIVNNILDY